MPGRFVRLNRPARFEVEGIAVRDDSQKRISVVLVNREDGDQVVTVQFTHLPFGKGSLKQRIRRIDATPQRGLQRFGEGGGESLSGDRGLGGG